MQAIGAPLDVRLMNGTATVLLSGVVVAALVALFGWGLRHPLFSIVAIQVDGDVRHSNAMTLRANVAPRLSGNFFTLDLVAAREAFEAVPWVHRAVVRREFPNRLRAILEEHQAVAYWGREGVDGESRLLGRFGEVFEANVGDVEADDLPRLWGPGTQSAEVLAMYRALAPLFESIDLSLTSLDLSEHASWRAGLDSGAAIELGRGTPTEIVERTRRFARTVTQAAAGYGRTPDAIESADLRHLDGYALRLRGVTTVEGAAPGQPKAPQTPRRNPQTRKNG